MAAAPNAWVDLPHGGALRSEAGVPVAVADKGAWQLDEAVILADAEALSGFKLTWMKLNRAERWQKASLLAALRPGGEWSWCVARVVPAACEWCGVAAGERWGDAPEPQRRAWLCAACAATGGQEEAD